VGSSGVTVLGVRGSRLPAAAAGGSAVSGPDGPDVRR